MERALTSAHYDLITPDGYIHSIDENKETAVVFIENISPYFVGFSLGSKHLFFNIKSTLAQLGINGVGVEYDLDAKNRSARVKVQLSALDPVAKQMIHLLETGSYIGKIFAKDESRRVRDPDYLFRMFGRCDREGRSLLSLGGFLEKELVVEKIEGRCVAFLSLKEGTVQYHKSIYGLLFTLALALKSPETKVRDFLQFHQKLYEDKSRLLEDERILLVKTEPLHIRTVFANVCQEFLPKGYSHTSASILQPDTMASGDIYEFFGKSSQEISDIPLEFYTLEPHREYVFFSDRDQLQSKIEDPKALFQAFDTAPLPKNHLAATFIVKGTQLDALKKEDWILCDPLKQEFPGMDHPSRQVHVVEQYIESQPSYPFLKAIQDGRITSQGILLSRYFPSSLLKRLLINDLVEKSLKQIYFEIPSRSSGEYFSHKDRSLMLDLAYYAVGIFWVDRSCQQILKFVLKPGKDTGMFVPLPLVEKFRKASTFGVYGSNLIEGGFEQEIKALLKGILEMRKEVDHPLLSKDTPIMLVTGGGPGAMEVGNRAAKSLDVLSCANIVDFRIQDQNVIHEQIPNSYIDAKMTYHLDHLVERQAEFHLDFPIFLMGGMGMDFEYTLEEVRRKIGAQLPTPVLLFGKNEYWEEKITSRFQCNLRTKTIAGSEWVSNCFYSVQTAQEGLAIYKRFFQGKLPIGKKGPIYEKGFYEIKLN